MPLTLELICSNLLVVQLLQTLTHIEKEPLAEGKVINVVTIGIMTAEHLVEHRQTTVLLGLIHRPDDGI